MSRRDRRGAKKRPQPLSQPMPSRSTSHSPGIARDQDGTEGGVNLSDSQIARRKNERARRDERKAKHKSSQSRPTAAGGSTSRPSSSRAAGMDHSVFNPDIHSVSSSSYDAADLSPLTGSGGLGPSRRGGSASRGAPRPAWQAPRRSRVSFTQIFHNPGPPLPGRPPAETADFKACKEHCPGYTGATFDAANDNVCKVSFSKQENGKTIKTTLTVEHDQATGRISVSRSFKRQDQLSLDQAASVHYRIARKTCGDGIDLHFDLNPVTPAHVRMAAIKALLGTPDKRLFASVQCGGITYDGFGPDGEPKIKSFNRGANQVNKGGESKYSAIIGPQGVGVDLDADAATDDDFSSSSSVGFSC